MTLNLGNMLKGCELITEPNVEGRIVLVQTIGNMQIAVLTSATSFDDNFANPFEALRVSNRTYGEIDFQNTSQEQDLIVAPQVAVMTGRGSQDHATTKAAAVRAAMSQRHNDAGCVQGSIAGYFRGNTARVIRFMPLVIREQLLERVNKTGSYNHLYGTIGELGEKTGVETGAYLEKYYKRYDAETQEFIAHFERPSHAIGTVTLVDGEIIAVDKFPSYRYVGQIWDAYVRDCLASVAIRSRANNTDAPLDFSEILNGIHAAPGEEISALFQAYHAIKQQISDNVRERLAEVLMVEFETEHDNDMRDNPVYKSLVLKSDGYIGQVIYSEIGTDVLYHVVNVVKRDRFDPTTTRESMTTLQRYRDAAQDQRDFSL